MTTPLGPRLLSRRGFVRLTGSALGTLGLAAGRLSSASAAEGRRRVYVLNPEWGAGRPGCPAGPLATHRRGGGGCHGCKACHRHAANKRFATAKAASRGRAHPGCRCRVEARFVSEREYARMFGGPSEDLRTVVYDRRW